MQNLNMLWGIRLTSRASFSVPWGLGVEALGIFTIVGV